MLKGKDKFGVQIKHFTPTIATGLSNSMNFAAAQRLDVVNKGKVLKIWTLVYIHPKLPLGIA